VYADSTTSPVVSIGIGNGNTPENSGPISGETYSGLIEVYATVSDTNLDNYHFRIVKSGGIDGYTCEGEGALFLSSNQGYASTTLGKDSCGYVYNQSVYTSTTGFINNLIATISSSEIISYSGEGEYWFIIGALDSSGNRSNANYLSDPKIKVIIASTSPVVSTSTNTSTVSGGGANGPIANSYGVVPSTFYQASISNPEIFTNPEIKNNTSNSGSSEFGGVLGDGGMPSGEYVNINSNSSEATTTTESQNSNQLAQVVSSGFSLNWLWLLLIIIIVGGYLIVKK